MIHIRYIPFVGLELTEILELPVGERIELARRIWESLPSGRDGVRLTETQERELDRRLAAFEAGEADLKSWDEVETRIKARLERRQA